MTETKLPWYKCTPAKFLSGDIMLCSLEEIGLFAIIEKIYWSRECNMTMTDLVKRIRLIPDHERILKSLVQENIVKLEGEHIVIEFLLQQWDERTAIHKKLSESGRKGAEIANAKRRTATPQAGHKNPENDDRPKQGQFFYIGMELYKSPISKYITDHLMISIDEFMVTMQHVKTPAVLKQMDLENLGTQFSDENHIRNTFKKLARVLNAQNTNPNNVKSANVATLRKAPNTDD